MCQGCHTKYCDDSSSENEHWTGCDLCWRWWHYWCGMTDVALGENTCKCLTMQQEVNLSYSWVVYSSPLIHLLHRILYCNAVPQLFLEITELPLLKSALYLKVFSGAAKCCFLKIRYRHSTEEDALQFQVGTCSLWCRQFTRSWTQCITELPMITLANLGPLCIPHLTDVYSSHFEGMWTCNTQATIIVIHYQNSYPCSIQELKRN